MFGYLLGWMTIFNLFDNAVCHIFTWSSFSDRFACQSLRVKMSYAGQLRDMNIISSGFLPTIFELLGLYGGKKKPLQLELWALQEYYVQRKSDSPSGR